MSEQPEVVSQLDTATRASLTKFVSAVRDGWRGREFEAVSLYTIGFLCPEASKGTAFNDPRQVCVLPCVPGVVGLHNKAGDVRVNADLAIFGKPMEYGFDAEWGPVVAPISIQEWKVATPRGTWSDAERPRDFLTRFSSDHFPFVGYLVFLNLRSKSPVLRTARFERGQESPEWLVL